MMKMRDFFRYFRSLLCLSCWRRVLSVRVLLPHLAPDRRPCAPKDTFHAMTQRPWLLALLSALTPPAALAVDLHKVATVEDQHQRPFWHLGEGFEGSSSDWTEYVVWLVGVIGVLYYMWNPNMRRNMHADDDDSTDDEWDRIEKKGVRH